MPPPTASDRPDFLELHDAVVASFSVLEDSSAVLRFSHLCAYRTESPGLFGVWSHGATLTLSGVEAVAFEGPWRLAAQGDAVDYAFVSPASAAIEGEGVSLRGDRSAVVSRGPPPPSRATLRSGRRPP